MCAVGIEHANCDADGHGDLTHAGPRARFSTNKYIHNNLTPRRHRRALNTSYSHTPYNIDYRPAQRNTKRRKSEALSARARCCARLVVPLSHAVRGRSILLLSVPLALALAYLPRTQPRPRPAAFLMPPSLRPNETASPLPPLRALYLGTHMPPLFMQPAAGRQPRHESRHMPRSSDAPPAMLR